MDKDHPDLIDREFKEGWFSRSDIDSNYGPVREAPTALEVDHFAKTPKIATVEPKGDPVYLGLLDELRELHLKKSADYGDGADPLANLRASVVLGIKPWVGCMLRCSDKMRRVQSLIRNGSLANESIEDNLKDMAAYCLLALKFIREGGQ